MIEFEDVSKTFNKGSSAEVLALKNINLKLEKGEFVVLIGANGSGKSTLLNVLAGSLSAETGKIRIDGNEISELAEHQRSKWIARIFQNPLAGTAPSMSVIENCRLASLRTSKKGFNLGITEKFKSKVRESLAFLQMGLESKLDQKVGSLSGGQRQALTLMMAVMDDAKVILMDEPSAALDPKSSEILLKRAANVIEMYQLSAIFVTHQLKDAHLYGNRLLHLMEGEVKRDLNADQKREMPLTEYFRWFS